VAVEVLRARTGWGISPVLLLSVFASSASAQPSTTGEAWVLDGHSYWRCHYTFRAPEDRRSKLTEEARRWTTPPAPDDWREPGFDDRNWHRTTASVWPGGGLRARRLPLALTRVCVRGKFSVTDPDMVRRLALTANLRPGVAVYLNGHQVARDRIQRGSTDLPLVTLTLQRYNRICTPSLALPRQGGGDTPVPLPPPWGRVGVGGRRISM